MGLLRESERGGDRLEGGAGSRADAKIDEHADDGRLVRVGRQHQRGGAIAVANRGVCVCL